ncbi:MAG TPA: FAD-dependent monooxygenase [Candidatus Binatia bacterium]|jgi:2-polyprenyl-6-methoxyphenol hydroxylase-like FAD-dependent oxidoreductase
MATEVLIVGAGPTGLALALWLARLGVAVRIVDESAGPGETSRAIAVHARTLELYAQLGIAGDVVAGGIKLEQLTLRRDGRRVAQLPLGDIGAGLSPFPYVLTYPQDLHERLLVDALARVGTQVERTTELVALEQDPGGVRATLRTPHGDEQVRAAYLCGCDGAGSATRRLVGADFPGGTYQHVFFVADAPVPSEVAAKGAQVCVSTRDFCLVFPIRDARTVRLIGFAPAECERGDDLRFADVAEAIRQTTGLGIETVNWFSSYRVHHRVAAHFRFGRAFLLGDAGHIHSPVGGQGMNTGIGDAANLGWKLAAVVQGRGSADLLDTYEPERIAFARTLVATTDRFFRLVASRGVLGELFRARVVPLLLPLLIRIPGAPRFAFRGVSQTEIRYRESALSAGAAGRVRGGDRLPWVPHDGGDNFAPLAALDWQVHVYGHAGARVRAASDARGIALHELPWSERAADAGLAQDAPYLVRPDGYVALAAAPDDGAALAAHLARFAVLPRPHAAGAA